MSENTRSDHQPGGYHPSGNERSGNGQNTRSGNERSGNGQNTRSDHQPGGHELSGRNPRSNQSQPSGHHPKVLVYQSQHPEKFADVLAELGIPNVTVARSTDEVEPDLSDVEIMFGWNIPIAWLKKAPNLRWVQWSGAGVDSVALKRDQLPSHLQLTRIVNQFSIPMAEYVFTYLLHVVKDVRRQQKAQEQKRWDPFRAPLLAGQHIGVAGLGSIGAEVVRKARAFDMQVSGLSATGRNHDMVDMHYSADEWLKFVEPLDILVLTLPLTERTRHVMNARVFDAMKDKAIIVNVGRGALIREADLIPRLASGRIQAAILDVFEREPLPADSPLWTLHNVFVSPHMSGPSETRKTSEFFAENYYRYLRQEPLQGVVDLTRQY
ncbi:D-2-hydroxyacid dehydrogenase [Alicyclobacillus curvatus]|nr:D-2-hydroxyacid dehydrogenase [Alicyclobacillus curvatus]